MNMEDVKMQNCAGCSKTLIGKSMGAWYNQLTPGQQRRLPPLCKGYILGRPYCAECLSSTPRNTHRKGAPHFGDPDPGTENAVRALEEDR